MVGQQPAQIIDVRRRAIAGNDDGTGAFAGARIGQPDHGDVGDVRLGDQQVLDLLGRDVLAVADDQILGAAGHHQIVLVHPCAQIARAEVAVGINGIAVVLRVQIADQHLWTAGPDLAVDEPDVGDARPAVGVGGMVGVARSGGPHRGDRHLGGPVDPGHDGFVEIVSGTADQRRRYRCATADEHLQIGQVGAGPLGGGQQTRQERRRAGHVGAALCGHQPHGRSGIPLLHQHRGGAQQQRTLEGVDGTADVRDGGGHQEPVGRLDVPVVAELTDECVQRVMRVQNTFGPTRGSRGVHDHPDVGGVQGRQRHHRVRGEQRLVRGVTRPADDDDLRWIGEVGDHPVQHAGVVVATELAGHEDDPGIDVVEDETELVVAQGGQDRVDGHPRQGGAEVDHRGLVPVGQHERDDAADGHPAQQRPGEHGGPLPQGRGIELDVAVDDQYAFRRGVAQRVGKRAGQGRRHPLIRRIVIECRYRFPGWVLMVTWAISPSEVV